MASKIAWTDETWNFLGGCTPISDGCKHCAAARQAQWLVNMGNKKYKGLVKNGKWTGEVRLFPKEIEKPLRWRNPRRIFPAFMSDLFHEKVPFDFIDKIYGTMILSKAQTSRKYSDRFHAFQLLTKRPGRMLEYHKSLPWLRISKYLEEKYGWNWGAGKLWHPENVHLGVTCENQAMADERIPILLQIPTAVRFVSIEPMLGPVVIPEEYLGKEVEHPLGKAREKELTAEQFISGDYPDDFIDWVIVGGESGPNARPIHPDWVRSIRDQCIAANVPFFFKQWGEWHPAEPMADSFPTCGETPDGKYKLHDWDEYRYSRKVGKKKAGNILDGKVWEQFPADLQKIQKDV